MWSLHKLGRMTKKRTGDVGPLLSYFCLHPTRISSLSIEHKIGRDGRHHDVNMMAGNATHDNGSMDVIHLDLVFSDKPCSPALHTASQMFLWMSS